MGIFDSRLFPNQSYGRTLYKHKKFPVYQTNEFDFFRCVKFDKNFYGKSVFELNAGNLRTSNINNRYSNLFPNMKVSYWADSIETARKESKKHCHSNDLITFWAYDDSTSTFPIIDNQEPLIIIDARDAGFHKILEKSETGNELSIEEKKMLKEILDLEPDCLAYWSVANRGGVNFIFFEKGFKKLSIRQVRLRLGSYKGKNTTRIICADTCDYAPYLKGYGECFLPLARTSRKEEYFDSNDYKEKKKVLAESYKRFRT